MTLKRACLLLIWGHVLFATVEYGGKSWSQLEYHALGIAFKLISDAERPDAPVVHNFEPTPIRQARFEEVKGYSHAAA